MINTLYLSQLNEKIKGVLLWNNVSLRSSEREDQRKDKDHHYSHEDLKRKSDLDIIHECVLSG